MSRINLVIADTDEMYLENLAGFIINKYYTTFKIKTFSRRELLLSYLSEEKWYSPDLLLLCDEFASDEEVHKLIGNDINPVLIGTFHDKRSDMLYIEKYQSAETITEEIVDYYSNINPLFKNNNSDSINTKIICSSSLTGGTGKSTIAVCICKQLASLGKKVLYLDLQTTNTTLLYYGNDIKYEMNLSNLIFGLKENCSDPSNLISKIVVKDETSNVYFIPPPYFDLEVEELTCDDIEDIIHELKICNVAEFIIVDTCNGLTAKNSAILKHSDIIMNIKDTGLVSVYKSQNPKLNELDNIKMFNSKIVNIINKYDQSAPYDIEKNNDIFFIPFIYNIYENKNNKIILNYDDKIMAVLNDILIKKKLV